MDVEGKMFLAMVGAVRVGKTAFLVRSIVSSFIENYNPTIEAIYNKQVLLDGLAFDCMIVDTSGDDIFSAIHNSIFEKSVGFIAMFSIDSGESFEAVDGFISSVRATQPGEKVPFILVGTKGDLANKREVSEEDAKRKAETYGVEYVESSAKDPVNVEETFTSLVRLARDNLILAGKPVPGVMEPKKQSKEEYLLM